MVKDDKWLVNHAEKFDGTVETDDDGAITGVAFGAVED